MKRFLNSQNILTIFCIIVLLYVAGKIVHIEEKFEKFARPTKLFSVSNVQSTLPYNPKWDVKISPELDTFFYVISQQQFNWLGKGAQALAFESQDGLYVLKLFQVGKFNNCDEPKSFLKRLFSKEGDNKRKERQDHREELFTSSKFAYEELQEETGIVYVHLNRTVGKIKGVKLIDRLGQSHRIRGDDACFILQKKACYLIPTITQLMNEGKIEAAEARIDQVIDLLFTMAKKGYVDNDDALIRNNNIGFTRDKAVYIDTGHLSKKENLDIYKRMEYEFAVRLDPLEKWLNWTYPTLANYYREQKDALMSSLKGEEAENSIAENEETPSVNLEVDEHIIIEDRSQIQSPERIQTIDTQVEVSS